MSDESDKTYEIRALGEEHVDDVIAIERMSYTNPWKLGAFRHEIHENPFSRPRVAVTRGTLPRVAGYCILWVVFEHAQIQNLAVHPHHRRRRLGTLLLRSAVAEARAAGAQTLALEARRSNRTAHRLYRAEGFAVVGERRAYYSRPAEDAIRFERVLDGVDAP